MTVFPVPAIDPAFACHVTPVFELPATEATNVCVPPTEMLVALGETVTETPLPPPELEVLGPGLPAPPQAASSRVRTAAAVPNIVRTILRLTFLMLVPGSDMNKREF